MQRTGIDIPRQKEKGHLWNQAGTEICTSCPAYCWEEKLLIPAQVEYQKITLAEGGCEFVIKTQQTKQMRNQVLNLVKNKEVSKKKKKRFEA